MKIYLAIPYTGNKEKSFKQANIKAGELMSQGHIVFSPISHSHPIASQCDLPYDWEFWKKQDESFIEWCDQFYIYCLQGWEKSKGVAAEIDIAKKLKKYIIYLGP